MSDLVSFLAVFGGIFVFLALLGAVGELAETDAGGMLVFGSITLFIIAAVAAFIYKIVTIVI